MAITRDSTGLLFRDQFNRADGGLGADWTTVAGTWNVASNEAKNTPSADNERTIASVLAARGSMVVQGKWLNTNDNIFPGLLLRWNQAGEHGYLFQPATASDVVLIYRLQSGSYTEIGRSSSFTLAPNTYYVSKALVANGLQRLWVDGTLRVSGTDTALDAVTGKAGLRTGRGAAGDARYDDFIVCTSNSITCAGLPTGWKIRVGTLVATESAGTATLDLAGTTLPAANVEVLDGSDVVQDTYTGEVWGGDAFTYASSTVVHAFPASFAAAFTAALVYSALQTTYSFPSFAAAYTAALAMVQQTGWARCDSPPATAWTSCSGGTQEVIQRGDRLVDFATYPLGAPSDFVNGRTTVRSYSPEVIDHASYGRVLRIPARDAQAQPYFDPWLYTEVEDHNNDCTVTVEVIPSVTIDPPSPGMAARVTRLGGVALLARAVDPGELAGFHTGLFTQSADYTSLQVTGYGDNGAVQQQNSHNYTAQVVAGETWVVKVQGTGVTNQVRVKFWRKADPEPAAWLNTYTVNVSGPRKAGLSVFTYQQAAENVEFYIRSIRFENIDLRTTTETQTVWAACPVPPATSWGAC